MEIQIYVGYEDVFQTQPPIDRISLIEQFSKKELLASLSLINLHPSKDPIYHHIGWEDQIRILVQLCTPDRKLFNDLRGINAYHKSLLQQNSSGVLFSRIANVVAMNEILENDRIPHESEERLNVKNLIEYYLSINSFLKSEQDKYSKQQPSLLQYYLVMAVYNEYNTPFFSFLELFRGVRLINYMLNDPDLSTDFRAYFASIGVDPYLYFPLVFSHVIPITKNREARFPSFKPTNKLVENVIRTLSDHEIVKTNPIEALNLKKNAFYPIGDNAWLLLDESFLVDHCFYYTINAFWFNHMKQKGYRHENYFGKIGNFYETYIAGMIKNSFHFLSTPVPKTLDELKVKPPGSEQIEVADIYIREGANIFIGEIKSTSYGTGFKYATDVISTFENNKERFIKDFGLAQVLKAIKFISEHHNLIDENAAEIKEFQIYPAVIFNERLFQTPLANLFFQNLLVDFFESIVGEFKKPKNITDTIIFRNFSIYPVSLIHTTELEILEPFLADKKINFWKILLSHQHKWGLRVPLYHTIMEHDPHELVNYSFQKIKPIIEDYDRRKKEILGDDSSPKINFIKEGLYENKVKNDGLVLKGFHDEDSFQTSITECNVGDKLQLRIDLGGVDRAITLYNEIGEPIGGIINYYDCPYIIFAKGLRDFLGANNLELSITQIDHKGSNTKRTYFMLKSF